MIKEIDECLALINIWFYYNKKWVKRV
jgi:hypothetical protein